MLNRKTLASQQTQQQRNNNFSTTNYLGYDQTNHRQIQSPESQKTQRGSFRKIYPFKPTTLSPKKITLNQTPIPRVKQFNIPQQNLKRNPPIKNKRFNGAFQTPNQMIKNKFQNSNNVSNWQPPQLQKRQFQSQVVLQPNRYTNTKNNYKRNFATQPHSRTNSNYQYHQNQRQVQPRLQQFQQPLSQRNNNCPTDYRNQNHFQQKNSYYHYNAFYQKKKPIAQKNKITNYFSPQKKQPQTRIKKEHLNKKHKNVGNNINNYSLQKDKYTPSDLFENSKKDQQKNEKTVKSDNMISIDDDFFNIIDDLFDSIPTNTFEEKDGLNSFKEQKEKKNSLKINKNISNLQDINGPLCSEIEQVKNSQNFTLNINDSKTFPNQKKSIIKDNKKQTKSNFQIGKSIYSGTKVINNQLTNKLNHFSNLTDDDHLFLDKNKNETNVIKDSKPDQRKKIQISILKKDILKKKQILKQKSELQNQYNRKLKHRIGTGAAWYAITHCFESKYSFLKNIRDHKARTPKDPGYDCTTLLIEPKYYQSMKDFERQYWEIKSINFDVVIFFKKGIFYELFETDAQLGNELFGLKLTKNTSRKMQMAGVPERSFEEWAAKFIANGFKIGKVDQVETVIQHKKRRTNSHNRSGNERGSRQNQKNKISNSSQSKYGAGTEGQSKNQILDNFKGQNQIKINDRKRGYPSQQPSHSSNQKNVLKRELTQVLTCGTLTDEQFINSAQSIYLLSFITQMIENNYMKIGVCIVDTSTGLFQLCEFADQYPQLKQFETLLYQIQPKEIIYPQGTDLRILKFLKKTIEIQPTCNCLTNEQCWDSEITLHKIRFKRYFFQNNNNNNNNNNHNNNNNNNSNNKMDSSENGKYFPKVFQKAINKEQTLLISAFGGCVSYLTNLKLDTKLVSYHNFKEYSILENSKSMILDAQTLINLEILMNNATGKMEGSLIDKLDHCKTNFGKRLLKKWLCHPLVDEKIINERLNAVEDLINNVNTTDRDLFQQFLKKLPDLERRISRIHSGFCTLKQFLETIEAFEKINQFIQSEVDQNYLNGKFKSKKLKRLFQVENNLFTLTNPLNEIFQLFDFEKTKMTNEIHPKIGLDQNYDHLIKEKNELLNQLDNHLKGIKLLFQNSNGNRADFKNKDIEHIKFKNVGKQKYLIEIPKSLLNKNFKIPYYWHLQSQTQKFKRYWTNEIQTILPQLDEIDDNLQFITKKILKNLFKEFCKYNQIWRQIIQNLSEFDVLLSFSLASLSFDQGLYCKPKFISPSKTNKNQQYFEVKKLIHPCVKSRIGQFIPNDTVLGSLNNNHPIAVNGNGNDNDNDNGNGNDNDNDNDNDVRIQNDMDIDIDKDDDNNKNEKTIDNNTKGVNKENLNSNDENPLALIIEGPNMAGKSTLLRQNCIAIILAQIGCFVPAESFTLTPVDRIFTRIGASDDIIHGQSTFMVELDETSTILKNVTEKSFVIMDELGRGTTTEDGFSIAYSVLDHLLTKNCRLLFSTHYHSLADEFQDNKKVNNYHMAYQTLNNSKQILLLYKLIPGRCSISFGTNVARMAGIPKFIVNLAENLALEFDKFAKLHHQKKLKQFVKYEKQIQKKKEKRKRKLIWKKRI